MSKSGIKIELRNKNMDTSKKIKALEIKLSKLINWWLFWLYKSKFHWSWMEFAEHREYIYWDSLKFIDWKAYNKTDSLYVKKFEEERDLNVLFVLDNSESMEFWSQNMTKKWLLEEVFYCLAISAYLNNDNVWAFIFDDYGFDYIEHKKSKENIYKILKKLEKQTSIKNDRKDNENSKIEEIINLIYKRNIKNNLIFILTDDIEIKNDKILKLLWIENEIIFINIFDIFETNLTELWGFFTFNNLDNFLNIDLWNKNNIKIYKKIVKEKFDYLNNFFRKNNIWYIRLNTDSNYFNDLLWYFYKIKN